VEIVLLRAVFSSCLPRIGGQQSKSRSIKEQR
jgi:hypothetical protein